MRIATEIAGRQCPKCGSAAEQIMFGKNLKGIQRYRCKKNAERFTQWKTAAAVSGRSKGASDKSILFGA